MFKLLLIIIICIFISALCSMSEAVLYSLSRIYIERLSKTHKKSAAILNRLRKEINKPITAILTVNTISNTAGAALTGAYAVEVLGVHSFLYFSIFFTIAILLFAEIIPKNIGVAYNKQLAPILAMPIYILVYVCTPLIWIINNITKIFSNKRGETSSREDVYAALRVYRRHGTINEQEELAIQNILLLATKLVRDIMTPRLVMFSLPVEKTIGETWKEHIFWPHSRVPVYQNDDREDIVGMIYWRELLSAVARDEHEKDLITLVKPLEFVIETLPVNKVLIKFLRSHQHLMAVLDEYGGVAGVISLEDVLEEMLGHEIMDETDKVADLRELAKQCKEKRITSLEVNDDEK